MRLRASGISLFLVPKLLPDDHNEPAHRNGVNCGSIRRKWESGSSACVINFDNAQGFSDGPENRGLACMFTMMNAGGWPSASRDWAEERLPIRMRWHTHA